MEEKKIELKVGMVLEGELPDGTRVKGFVWQSVGVDYYVVWVSIGTLRYSAEGVLLNPGAHPPEVQVIGEWPSEESEGKFVKGSRWARRGEFYRPLYVQKTNVIRSITFAETTEGKLPPEGSGFDIYWGDTFLDSLKPYVEPEKQVSNLEKLLNKSLIIEATRIGPLKAIFDHLFAILREVAKEIKQLKEAKC